MHSNKRGECCLLTLVDQKRKRYDNAVDVVVRLHDPTDPSTESTAPPRSAHVRLGDVPRTLDPAECRGRPSSALFIIASGSKDKPFPIELVSEFEGRHRAERVLNSEVSYVRYLDWSDREDVRLHQPRCANASAYGLRGYVDNTLPSRCYASP